MDDVLSQLIGAQPSCAMLAQRGHALHFETVNVPALLQERLLLGIGLANDVGLNLD